MQQYSVDSRTIENVIGYIKDGQISIPEIQRPFVWNGSKIRDLIDSLYHGYPIGYLIVWQNPSIKDKNGNSTSGKKIMIDGQQRITAIMTAIVGMKVLDKNFKECVYKIAFNPFAENSSNCFEVLNASIQWDRKWIQDISILFKPDFDQYTFVNEFCRKNPEIAPKDLNALVNNVLAIKNAPIGIINLSDALSIDEVTEIFIRINNQGKSLTQSDFVMSTIAADDKYGGNMLRKAIDYFCHLGQDKTFINQIDKDAEFVNSEYYNLIKWYGNSNIRIYNPSFEDLIRTSFMCKYYRGKVASFTEMLHGRNFETKEYEESIMKDTIENFAAAAKIFMHRYAMTQFVDCLASAGFVNPRLIRSRVIVDFAYMLYIRLRSEKLVDVLKVNHYVQRWYVMSVITGRYNSSPETQFEKDLREIKERGFLPFFEGIMRNLGDDYWNITLPQALQTSSSYSPVFNVFLAAQCKLNDDSFLGNGSKVRDLLETADIHHLFPKQYLCDNGINDTLNYNQVANFAVLSKPVNIVIGKKAPAIYMREITDSIDNGYQSQYTTIQTAEELVMNREMNCIPDGFERMTKDNYYKFLEKRRCLMARKIRMYFYSL